MANPSAEKNTSEGFWSLVWIQLRRNRLAMRGGFFVIATLVCLALFADLLANEKPYIMKMNGTTYFPIFRNYLVETGLAEWPEPLVNFDYKAAKLESAVFPPVPYLPNRVDLTQAFEKPSRRHLLGTDRLGRDVLSGIIHGARVSISIGLVAMGIATVIGVIVGAIAGFFGGWADMIINRIFELMISIPTFFLILTISAFVKSPSIFYIMIIIGLTSWVGIARFTRNEFLKVRNLDYVSAAIALGAPHGRIMFRHILPNTLAPVIVSVVFGIAGAILVESSLSFLGIGVPADAVTWGSLLNEVRGNTFAWWLAVFPGMSIFITVLAYNLLGQGLRDAMDPSLRL
jgi:peptide/nickel transport system permease protein